MRNFGFKSNDHNRLIDCYNFPEYFASTTCSIRFVCINVHCQSKFIRIHALQYRQTLLFFQGYLLYPNNLFVLYAKFSSISRSHMDMTFCNNNAFCQFDLTSWTYYFAAWSSFQYHQIPLLEGLHPKFLHQ